MSGMKILGVTAVILLSLAVALPAAAAGFTFDFESDLVTRYIWRGIELDSEWCFQPALIGGWEVNENLTLEFKGWWNFPLDNHNSETWRDQGFEQDFTLALEYIVSDTTNMVTGFIYYSNPNSNHPVGDPNGDSWQTNEVYVGTTYQGDISSLSLMLYYDIGKVKGWYLDLSGDMVFPVNDRVNLRGAIQVGLGEDMNPNLEEPGENFWFYDDGLVNGNVSLGLNYSFSAHFSAAATINYSLRFDGFSDEVGMDDDEYLWSILHFAYTL